MSADFFSRLIGAQVKGPNMQAPSDGKCLTLYVCYRCDEEHEDETDAEDCCKPEVYAVYRCSVCRKRHTEEDDAESCCPAIANGQPMQCPVCLQGADSFEIAADCCLHVHPTLTAFGRQRVAEAVASGTPWDEALAANINH